MKKRQLIPLILLLLLIAAAFFLNIHHEFSLSHLRREHDTLRQFVEMHPFLSPLIYLLIYTVSVILIIPDSTILTLAGALFFPWPLALLYALTSETLGALIFFYAARSLSKAEKKEYKFIHKVRRAFAESPASYLLFLRVSHLLPFWVISLSAAYFNARPRTFIWTTFVGTIPLTAFLISAGHDLETAIAKNIPFKISALFTLHTKLAFIGIGLLTLLPLIYRKWIKR